MSEWRDVARVLLGSWPAQVSSWGREAMAAYISELQARSLSPDEAVLAIRQHNEPFPPSVGEIAQAATADPERPTATEAYAAIYDPRPPQGGRGVLWTHARGIFADADQQARADRQARLDRAYEIHPLIGRFVESYGLGRLELAQVEHDEYGGVVRRDIQQAWAQFERANEHRDSAALAAGRRREIGRPGLRKLNPSAVGLIPASDA